MMRGFEVEVPELPTCNVCQQRPALFDGKTIHGPWAYMCVSCFERLGVGLGVGYGQQLIVKAPK